MKEEDPFHGSTMMMDLGVGAKGVEESDVALGVVDKLHKGLLTGPYTFVKWIAPLGGW